VIDFDALVFGPVYSTFGQPAVLTLGRSSYDLVVIDNTKGVVVDEAGSIGVQTIRPAVDVRRSGLVKLGLTARDLVDSGIEFNDAAWRIKSVLENGDEIRLILIEPLDTEVPMHLLTEAGEWRITEAGDFLILE
jgi:hypothetical protein